jgi:hypothetical protein
MRVDVPQTVGRLRGAENERRFNRYGMALIGLVTYGDYGIVIVTAHQVRVQPVSATPLVVYRLAFGSPRSFAGVD